MMAYADWHKAFSTLVIPGSPRDEARLWNLTHDNRINRHRGRFKRKIGRYFDDERGGGKTPNEAATEALNRATDDARPVGSEWLGLLQAAPQDEIPSDVVTFLSSSEIRRANPGVPRFEDNPSPESNSSSQRTDKI